MKRTKLIVIFLAVLVLSIALVFFYINSIHAETRKLERDWGVSLPNNTTKVVYKNEVSGWFGKGIKYVVFNLKMSLLIY